MRAGGAALPDKDRRQIEAWRRRAAELRATADNFKVPSAQMELNRAAANYEQMADHAETLLTVTASEKTARPL
jgi:hypothetical protein